MAHDRPRRLRGRPAWGRSDRLFAIMLACDHALGTPDSSYVCPAETKRMRYLAATDGSTVGDDAVRYAARNALAFDATLVIVHVLTPESELIDGTLVMPGEEAALDEGERVLTGAEAVAEGASDDDDTIEIETELLTGRPATAITEFATETNADAIFVGHRGLSAEREQVVGSVAKSVVDKASIPVTITR